jgi:hypothetical protein
MNVTFQGNDAFDVIRADKSPEIHNGVWERKLRQNHSLLIGQRLQQTETHEFAHNFFSFLSFPLNTI